MVHKSNIYCYVWFEHPQYVHIQLEVYVASETTMAVEMQR